MIGHGGHAKQIKAEFGGDMLVVAIGDNRTRKRVVAEEEAKGIREWSTVGNLAATHLYGLTNAEMRSSVFDEFFPKVGHGTVCLAGSFLGAGSVIGKHCIINHGAVVEHGAELGDYVHVAPGAKVLGDAIVGEGALIGANAIVLPGTHVPAWGVVRACSVYPADYQVPPDPSKRHPAHGDKQRMQYQEDK